MTTPTRIITSTDELLAVMRENPTVRRISSWYTEEHELAPTLIVIDCHYGPDGHALKPTVTIAEIAPGSEADRLCGDVARADAKPDPKAWAKLPLRYQVRGSSCLLPEHPDAPRTPGGLARAHQALDGILAIQAARGQIINPSAWRRLRPSLWQRLRWLLMR